MTSSASSRRPEDGRLWVIALGLSLILNVAILALAGFISLKAEVLRKSQPVIPRPAPAVTTVTIFPELVNSSAKSVTAPPAVAALDPAFARTSADQTAAAPPETHALIGERNTQATSDRTPNPTAPALPSQKGIQKNRADFETTESDYQDGKQGDDPPTTPQDAMPVPPPSPPAPVSDPAVAEHAPVGETIETPGNDSRKSSPPPRDQLVDGPNPVDIPVPKELPEKAEIKPAAPTLPKQGSAANNAADLPKPAAKPTNDPAFHGYQRKAAIVGSISRTGRSALDVTDSPLGRYQAIISRAVELEWQRNCVRHRDFITPGFLTVRFFVETSGRVRTVQFVGDMETGEVQKGFTLNSIRDAEIPAMPAGVKKDFEKEPLELIFNFYF